MAGRRTTTRATRTRRTAGAAAPVLVKVARTGGQVTEYALNGEHTVREAMELAGMTTNKGDRVRVNGRVAEHDTVLHNNDIVIVAGRVEGGSK